MKKIFRISTFIFKQGIKEKVFVGLLFFFIFMLAVCIFLGKISAGEEIRILRNAGVTGIEFCGLLVVLFFVSQNFYQQKYTKMLDLFIVKFDKKNSLCGYFLGYLFIVFFFILFAYLLFIPICLFFKAFYPGIILGGVFTFFKLSITLGFCLLFLCFFESPLISFLSTLFLYISSEAAYSALKVVLIEGSVFQKVMVKIIYRILPNMDKLNVKDLICYGQYPSGNFFVCAFIYSFVYMLFLFFISLAVFKKKEYA